MLRLLLLSPKLSEEAEVVEDVSAEGQEEASLTRVAPFVAKGEADLVFVAIEEETPSRTRIPPVISTPTPTLINKSDGVGESL